jgi:hypothetical protein
MCLGIREVFYDERDISHERLLTLDYLRCLLLAQERCSAAVGGNRRGRVGHAGVGPAPIPGATERWSGVVRLVGSASICSLEVRLLSGESIYKPCHRSS